MGITKQQGMVTPCKMQRKRHIKKIGSLAIHKVSIYVTKHQCDDVEGMAENKTATKCLEAQNRSCSVQNEMAPGQSAMKQVHT